MGGNLFKVQRITKAEYEALIASLLPILDKHFGGNYRIPKAYHNKSTYGDVDIILNEEFIKDREWRIPLLIDLGKPLTMRIRSITSVLYRDFQVDFFSTPLDRFESTYNFMCYNILGNLIGRIYHKFNLKYGEEGLIYVLRGYNNHISQEVVLSRDMKQMLEFIDLDYERWTKGFDDLTDIFEYVIGSKYFCAESYSLDFFNVRKRAVERPDFNTFLDYIHDNHITKNYPFDRDKDVYIPMIDAAFPESKLGEKYSNHLRVKKEMGIVATKFNGDIVTGLIPLEGKELGDFMRDYKLWKGEDFMKFILDSNQGLIDFSIKNFYNKQLSEKNV